ncbi:hypothetical protein [uncultured Tessaracoccus sp.]|uniref:hypothetical protein n=1 Tax=uncultured Tessaracoccus sp. TaxID=905023 RepID=UPI00263619B2|nr:hypothetical protein [uncultured Tessaracoccus sp.]
MSMKKKLFAGLAALALAGGMTLGGVTVANADDATPEMDKLCVDSDSNYYCDITLESASTVTEGESVVVSVIGNPEVTVELAIFGPTPASFTLIGNKVPVTLNAEGEGSAELTVPELVDHVGGEDFVVATSDFVDAATELEGTVYADFTVHSRNAALVGDPTGDGTAGNPFVLNLGYGLEGDVFKAQALVNGKWMDFHNVGENAAIGEDGTTELTVTSPEIADGEYKVRFFNVTKNVAGPVQAVLYIGVASDEDDDGADDGGDKGDDQDGKTGSKKPSLPSTGV